MVEAPGGPDMRTFWIVWAGQLVSLIGTNLTFFGLSVWVFEETGSVTLLATVLLASQLPAIVVGPVAGSLVDRWDRRHAMILADAGAAIGTVALVVAYLMGGLTIWTIAVAVAVAGFFQAFQWPAYHAAMAVIVPKDRFGRASGMVQLAEAVGQLGGPLLAGILLVVGGLGAVFAVDVLSFMVAVGTLLAVRFPRPPRSDVGVEGAGTLWHETRFGFRYLWERPGLFGLLVYFAVLNLAFAFFGPLFIPLGLSMTSAAGLGTAFSIASAGMLAGSVVAGAWGGPRRRVLGLVVAGALVGIAFGSVGLRPSIVWATAAAFVGFVILPTGNTASQALWLAKVEADMQGRVAAIRRFFSQLMVPIAYVVVGPLADRVFEPAMADDGRLAGILGPIFGTGPGRGYALFFTVIGLAVLVISAITYAVPAVRHLERDIPDAVQDPDDPASSVRGVDDDAEL